MNRMQAGPKIGHCRAKNAAGSGRAVVFTIAGSGLAVVLGLVGCVEPLGPALQAETARVAIQSQCAQNVINCTTSWPVARFQVQANGDQTVILTDTGYLIEGSDGNGQESVQFIGSTSTPGDDATITSFSWSKGASDEDPKTLAPGTEFSDDTDPNEVLAVGFHYIRLTVQNSIIREQVVSDEFGLIAENVPSFDFIELEVEVRD